MILNAIGDYNRVINEHQDTNLKLEFTSSKEDIFIEADKSRINQVISNLLSNAIKFTKEGTITAAVVPKNNEIIVTINDTGSGIDSEILPKLFTRFATTTTKYKTGTGLGLFISKNIIEAHGGKIWEKIITLQVKELVLDLAYRCKIGILEYSGELEDTRNSH